MNPNIRLFVAVKAFILNEKGEVLLLREASSYADGTNIGRYDVPGGRIDSGESLNDALVREVREETGLLFEQSELVDVHDTFNQKGDEVWHIVRLFYKITSVRGEVALSEDHDEHIWVPVKEVVQRTEVIANLIPILKKLV